MRRYQQFSDGSEVSAFRTPLPLVDHLDLPMWEGGAPPLSHPCARTSLSCFPAATNKKKKKKRKKNRAGAVVRGWITDVCPLPPSDLTSGNRRSRREGNHDQVFPETLQAPGPPYPPALSSTHTPSPHSVRLALV